MSTKRKPVSARNTHGHGQEDNGGRLCSSKRNTTPTRPGRQVVTVGGKVVAVIVGDSLTKHITARHYLRDPKAIAFAEEAITAAQAAECARLIVTDTDTQTVYSSTWADFMTHSWIFDRGYGPQRAMRLSLWHVDGKPPADGNPPVLTVRSETQPQQLTLW